MSNRWVIGGLVVAIAALSVYFAVAEKKNAGTAPVAQAEPEQRAPATPPGPVVLPAVVDVLDIDPLLDPPPIPKSEPAPPGVVVTTLDDEPPAAPTTPTAAPAVIPPAVD